MVAKPLSVQIYMSNTLGCTRPCCLQPQTLGMKWPILTPAEVKTLMCRMYAMFCNTIPDCSKLFTVNGKNMKGAGPNRGRGVSNFFASLICV